MKHFQTLLTEIVSSDHRYLYHGTNDHNLHDIIETKKLKTFKPWHGTDQDVWPDGSTKKRSYWTDNFESVKNFFPTEGKPIVLRVQFDKFPFRQEKYTGDFYLEKDVGIKNLQRLSNGKWISLTTDSLTESVSRDVLRSLNNAESKEQIEKILNENDISYEVLNIEKTEAIIFDNYVVDDFSYPDICEKEDYVERNYDDVLPNLDEKIHENFWKYPEPLYHATTHDENVQSILKQGLLIRKNTRGISNRNIGSAIFAVSDINLLLTGEYGNFIFEIDTIQMKKDGVLPFISKETLIIENIKKEYLAELLKLKDYQAEISLSEGIWEETFVIYDSISAKYLTLQ